MLIAVVYRPPKIGFIDIFEEEFAATVSRYKFAFILGDFNADLLSNTYDAEHLRSFLKSQDLYLIPYQPTHHTKDSHTWLDICAATDFNSLVSWGQSAQPFLSGHDLIFVSFKYIVARCAPRTFCYRSWDEANLEEAARIVSSFDFSLFENLPDIDHKLTAFNCLLKDVLDCAVPVKEVTVKRSPAPWFTISLRSLMKERDACYRAAKRSGSHTVFAKYVELRREFKKKLGAAKSNYLNSKFNDTKNVRLFWREIDKLGITRTVAHEFPEHVSPHSLNLHFASVSTNEMLPVFLKCVDTSLSVTDLIDTEECMF
ncbi:uncharacterized protein LOC107269298 isoform X1 [Cephus cinctus]|uniref:Uncharacterized protein LOC107269298 isoform X1 n=1 Tax=Cephus cinctus TaxID=211228 RepID=A0AAJ7BZR6_CEPCN|nr:uncharacterized protein LOC107269298 isoform X1 [Cephus cinctus]